MKKPLGCKLGIHSIFIDSVGERKSIGEYEFWIWHTYETCNYCEYRNKIS